MDKLTVDRLVVLKFTGSFESGFVINLQLGEENKRPTSEVLGELPPALDLLSDYDHWQRIYRSLDFSGRPVGLAKSTRTATVEECCQAAALLGDRLNHWLQAASFRPIREKWLEKLLPSDRIRIILQTHNAHLQKLPWHLWDLMARYPNAEIAFSAPAYEQVNRHSVFTPVVKILALLGDSTGINVQADRALLEQLPDATVTFLVEPARKDLTDRLWEQDWDILFFAGHSCSQQNFSAGQFDINPTESLTIAQLKYALKKAVDRGLKLAIFNSCDGLGLAQEFADLHIPQMIVMREPVPDRIAQEFLKYFLDSYAHGASLYLAVRQARERLQGLEGQFPCATWLPMICQNPAEIPPTWQELIKPEPGFVEPQSAELTDTEQFPEASSSPELAEFPGASRPLHALRPERGKGSGFLGLLLTSAAISGLLMGVRYMGLLQSLELQAYDRLLQLHPDELPDDRLFVITITEADVQAQAQESRRGSLSDLSLAKLLEKLEAAQPTVIGLDIYRDYPVMQSVPHLGDRLQQNNRLVSVCKVSDPDNGRLSVAPPPEVPSDRLGFSDLVIDTDGVVRRHLLALTPPPASTCTAPYAFSTQLALRYLAAHDVALTFSPTGVWQLGNTHFPPVEAHTGGYQRIDAWGHQILLNYRSHRSLTEIAPQATLTQVLTGQIPASAIKDRIVLIGTTAESFQDYSLTPFSTAQGARQKIPGVMLQAQMVSQIVSAVLDGRSLVWTWAIWQEALWVWSWAVTGGLIAYLMRRLPYWSIACGIAIVALYGFCLVVWVQWSGWIPLVPAAIALMGSSGTVFLYINWLGSSNSKIANSKTQNSN